MQVSLNHLPQLLSSRYQCARVRFTHYYQAVPERIRSNISDIRDRDDSLFLPSHFGFDISECAALKLLDVLRSSDSSNDHHLSAWLLAFSHFPFNIYSLGNVLLERSIGSTCESAIVSALVDICYLSSNPKIRSIAMTVLEASSSQEVFNELSKLADVLPSNDSLHSAYVIPLL